MFRHSLERKASVVLLISAALTLNLMAQVVPKANHWCYSNVRAYSDNTIIGPSYWFVKDFGAVAINPNTAASVRARFRVSQPNFLFCPDGSGSPGTCKRDSITVPDSLIPVLNPYSTTERAIAAYLNTPGKVFPPTNIDEYYDFTGTVEVFSSGSDNLTCTDPNYSTLRLDPSLGALFYSQNVLNLTSPEGSGSPRIAGFIDSWQRYNQFTDVFWDSDVNEYLAPFAIFYFNVGDWPYGWQTQVSRSDQSGPNVQVLLTNHLSSGTHNHAAGCDPKFTDGPINLLFNSVPGTTVDAFRWHLANAGDVRWRHDTALSIAINPVVSGVTFAVHVFPNTSNNGTCAQ